MTNLMKLRMDLKALEKEAIRLGMSRAMRDRIHSMDIVIEVVERERQKKGAA